MIQCDLDRQIVFDETQMAQHTCVAQAKAFLRAQLLPSLGHLYHQAIISVPIKSGTVGAATLPLCGARPRWRSVWKAIALLGTVNHSLARHNLTNNLRADELALLLQA